MGSSCARWLVLLAHLTFAWRVAESQAAHGGIPVTCNQGGGDLVLKNEQEILNQCGSRMPVRQQVECMRHVTVQTSGCNVTFVPQLEAGSVCPGFPCSTLTWRGVSIGGQVQTVHLSVNVAAICSFLTDVNNAKACKDMLVLCAAGSGPPGGYKPGSKVASNASIITATAATASAMFRCEADSTFAPEDRGSRINITSMVVSIVLGTALLVVVVSSAICLARRWRERRRRKASMQSATFELGASMFDGPVHGRGPANGVYAHGLEGLVPSGGVANGVHEDGGEDCYRSSTPDGVISWGHERRKTPISPKKQ